MLLERLNEGDDFIETLVRVELCLDIGELDDGTVSTSTTVAMDQYVLKPVD